MRVYRWVIAKYAIYILLAILLFHLQSVPHFLSISGIRPMPLIALAFAVAVVESEVAGGLFGIFCGYLCDLFSYETMGYYMLFLFVLCIGAGLLRHSFLRISWPICGVITLLAMLFIRCIPLVFRFVFPQLAGGWHILATVELPMCAYTAVLSIPLFLLVRKLSHEAAAHSETRF